MREITVRIGELARAAGVSVRSLRYYEEQGLLTSTRSTSGQRLYVEADVDRVRLLQCLYSAGLSSRVIAGMALPCIDSPSAEHADEAWAQMQEERQKIDARIGDLLHARDILDQFIAVNREYRESLRDSNSDKGLRPSVEEREDRSSRASSRPLRA